MRVRVGKAYLSEDTSKHLKDYLGMTFEELQEELFSHNYEIKHETRSIDIREIETTYTIYPDKYFLIKYNHFLQKFVDIAPLYPDENGAVYQVYLD